MLTITMSQESRYLILFYFKATDQWPQLTLHLSFLFHKKQIELKTARKYVLWSLNTYAIQNVHFVSEIKFFKGKREIL